MNEIEKTDVCIIGSGPSGAATSIMLSKLKIPHYIIDKSTFPRDKTCGDGLILYAYKAMKLLGEDIFKDFLNNPKFIHSKSIRLHVTNNTNINFRESEDRDMAISYAKRIDFDAFLVDRLSNQYATKFFGTAVKKIEEQTNGILVTLKDSKQILAKLVVGADGVGSIVSRKLAKNKIDKKYASTFVSAYFKGVTNFPTDKEAEIRMVHKKTLLFFYIFPLSDGQVNISLGGRADQIKKHNINLIEELEFILKNHSKVKDRFINATRVGSWRGWSIPFHFFKYKTYGNRFLLVGDAAGLANAFYKEGVGTGMMSGIIAANHIEKYLKNNDFSESTLKSYDVALKNEFGKLLKFSNVMLKAAKYKNLFSSAVSLLKKRVEKRAQITIRNRSY